MSAAAGRPQPIPLTVVTGARGAGKTRLINAALSTPALAGAVVIQNESGAVALERAAVVPEPGNTRQAPGCLCCTGRGDLVPMLEDLLRRRDNARMAPFTHLIIETTGEADPAPLVAAVLAHPYLKLRYRLCGIIAVVDGAADPAMLVDGRPAFHQVTQADVIVLSLRDKANTAPSPALGAMIGALNAAAPRMQAEDVAAMAGWLFTSGSLDLAQKPEAARRRILSAMMRPGKGA